ncbi:hypothetical protein [Streptomyces minutiscleroticus]|uniref:hypothetical protein n=1 Tax=Streptomyces minutiscleroticus TaxID=68238 RepID=UPI003333C6C6
MSHQQPRRDRFRPEPLPGMRDGGGSGRIVRWLGGFGCVAAGYAVFQSLLGVLPPGLDGESARYAVAVVSGLGTAAAAWLSAALLRARAADPARTPGPFTARRAGTAPAAPAPGPLPRLCASAYETLVEQVRVVDDPDRGRLTGWPHSLGEQEHGRPTSVGTAYGLHTLLDLGTPDGRLGTGELVRTLWNLQLPDGGWSARSQGAAARPEVTALVLGALARAGADPVRVAAAAEACTARFTDELDRTGRELTHVVTTVLRGLLRAAPGSEALPRLRDALAAGAITDPRRGHRRCWAYRLAASHGPPSAVHTAQAVLALDRAARVAPEPDAVRAAREDGVRWLLACPDTRHDGCLDLTPVREEVRRPRIDDPARHEVLNVRHFAAAWVLRALLTPGARAVAHEDGLEDAWRERLNGAAAAVAAAQTDGIWTWSPDNAGELLRRPLWMTYQGLSALRAHAIWMYRPDD